MFFIAHATLSHDVTLDVLFGVLAQQGGFLGLRHEKLFFKGEGGFTAVERAGQVLIVVMADTVESALATFAHHTLPVRDAWWRERPTLRRVDPETVAHQGGLAWAL